MNPGSWHAFITLLVVVVACKALYKVTQNGEKCEFWWSENSPPTTPVPSLSTTAPEPCTSSRWRWLPLFWFAGILKKGFDFETFIGDETRSWYNYICSYIPHSAPLLSFYILYYPVRLQAMNGSLEGLDMGCKGLTLNVTTYQDHQYDFNVRLNMTGLQVKYSLDSNINMLGSKIDFALENGSAVEFIVKVNNTARCLIEIANIDVMLVIKDDSGDNFCTGFCHQIQQELICLIHKGIRQLIQISSWSLLQRFIHNVFCISWKP